MRDEERRRRRRRKKEEEAEEGAEEEEEEERRIKNNKIEIFKFVFLSFRVGKLNYWDILYNSIEKAFVCNSFVALCYGFLRAASTP